VSDGVDAEVSTKKIKKSAQKVATLYKHTTSRVGNNPKNYMRSFII